jgi:hypothetical protein
MVRLLVAITFAIGTLGFLSPAKALVLYSTGNDGGSLYTIDSSDGVGTLVGNFGYSNTYSVAFNPSNVLYSVVDSYDTSTLATVNLTTGAATPVGAGTGILDLMALGFVPNGTLYAASWSTNDLYTLNPTTGAATLVGSLGFSGVMDLQYDPTNGGLYAIASLGSGSSLYQVNTATGAGSLVTTITGDDCLMGLTITPSNQFLATDYCAANSPLYQIDTATGALTDLGNTGISGAMGLTYQSQAVPEPASWTLLGAALLGVVGVTRRLRPGRGRASFGAGRRQGGSLLQHS